MSEPYEKPTVVQTSVGELFEALAFEALADEIHDLASVLLREFGSPRVGESACEMATRVLREQQATIDKLTARRE